MAQEVFSAQHDRCDHEVGDCLLAGVSDNISTDLSALGHAEFKKFLASNYKNYDPARYPAFVEWLGDHEGYVEINQFDSVSGVPITIDLRSSEYWEASA